MSACPPKFDRNRGNALRDRPAFSGPACGARHTGLARHGLGSTVDSPSRAPQSGPLNDDAHIVRLRDGDLWVAPHDFDRALPIRCVSGNVWLTQEGRAEDIVLAAGGLARVAGEGKLIVQALEDAVIRVGS